MEEAQSVQRRVESLVGKPAPADISLENADTVNLGQDTVFCEGETILLNAGFGLITI